jgi:hypothetical protein
VPRKMPKEPAKSPDAPSAKLSLVDWQGHFTTGMPTGTFHIALPYVLS